MPDITTHDATVTEVAESLGMPDIPEWMRSSETLARKIYDALMVDEKAQKRWSAALTETTKPYLALARALRDDLKPFLQGTADKAVRVELRAKLDEHQRFVDDMVRMFVEHGKRRVVEPDLTTLAAKLSDDLRELTDGNLAVWRARVLMGRVQDEVEMLKQTADMISSTEAGKAHAETLRMLGVGMALVAERALAVLDGKPDPVPGDMEEEDRG